MIKNISNNYISIHKSHNNSDCGELFSFVNEKGEPQHFGILNIKINNGSTSKITWDIVFSIDNSGSMNTNCDYKRKSKLDYIKETMSNIIKIFSENKNNIFNVYIQIFNNEIKEILDFTQITVENVNSIIEKISSIRAYDFTNLKKPLTNANGKLKKRKELYNNHKFLHIELTDGDDTTNNSTEELINNVCNEFKNIFIGLGQDHNSMLLDSIAYHVNSEYRFIDKIESAGLVYGEIVHGILYNEINNAYITIENGELYDWKKNEWVHKLEIGSLCKGCEKTFHIRTVKPMNVYGKLYGIHNDSNQNEIELIDNINIVTTHGSIISYNDSDHTKYIFRQKTQELLYKAKYIYLHEKRYNRKERLEINKKFKLELVFFFKKMKKYMKKNNLLQNKFWKMLLDDIYITFKTFNTSGSYMYSSSRQISQGSQTTYAVNNIDCFEHIDMFDNNTHYNNIGDTQRIMKSSTYIQNNNNNIFNKNVPYLQFINKNDLSQNNHLTLDMDIINNDFCFYAKDIDSDDSTEEEFFMCDLDIDYELSDNIDSPYTSDEIINIMKKTVSHR